MLQKKGSINTQIEELLIAQKMNKGFFNTDFLEKIINNENDLNSFNNHFTHKLNPLIKYAEEVKHVSNIFLEEIEEMEMQARAFNISVRKQVKRLEKKQEEHLYSSEHKTTNVIFDNFSKYLSTIKMQSNLICTLTKDYEKETNKIKKLNQTYDKSIISFNSTRDKPNELNEDLKIRKKKYFDNKAVFEDTFIKTFINKNLEDIHIREPEETKLFRSSVSSNMSNSYTIAHSQKSKLLDINAKFREINKKPAYHEYVHASALYLKDFFHYLDKSYPDFINKKIKETASEARNFPITGPIDIKMDFNEWSQKRINMTKELELKTFISRSFAVDKKKAADKPNCKKTQKFRDLIRLNSPTTLNDQFKGFIHAEINGLQYEMKLKKEDHDYFRNFTDYEYQKHKKSFTYDEDLFLMQIYQIGILVARCYSEKHPYTDEDEYQFREMSRSLCLLKVFMIFQQTFRKLQLSKTFLKKGFENLWKLLNICLDESYDKKDFVLAKEILIMNQCYTSIESPGVLMGYDLKNKLDNPNSDSKCIVELKSQKLNFENKSHVNLAYYYFKPDSTLELAFKIEPVQSKEINTCQFKDWVIARQKNPENRILSDQETSEMPYDQYIACFSPSTVHDLDMSKQVKLTTNEKFRTLYIDPELNTETKLITGIRNSRLWDDLVFWKTYLIDHIDNKIKEVLKNHNKIDDQKDRIAHIRSQFGYTQNSIFLHFALLMKKMGIPYITSKKFIEDFMKMYEIKEKGETWNNVENILQGTDHDNE